MDKFFNDKQAEAKDKRNALIKNNAELLQKSINDKKLRELKEKEADLKILQSAKEAAGIEGLVVKKRSDEYARELMDDIARREAER